MYVWIASFLWACLVCLIGCCILWLTVVTDGLFLIVLSFLGLWFIVYQIVRTHTLSFPEEYR